MAAKSTIPSSSLASDGDEIQTSQLSSKVPSSSGIGMASDVFRFINFDYLDNLFPWFCSLCKSKDKHHRWKTRSTSNFRKDLTKDHADMYCSSDPLQSTMKHHFQSTSSAQQKQKAQPFDRFTKADTMNADQHLTDWIVNHAQPFNVVEQKDFLEFGHAHRDDYSVPTRNTVQQRILSRWKDEKQRFGAVLQHHLQNGRRCGITTDMWTSAANRGYMVVTIHNIAEDWEPHSVIIAFIRVMYPHTGERLGDHLIDAIENMNSALLKGVCSITADNASSNCTRCERITESFQDAITQYHEETIGNEAAGEHCDDAPIWQSIVYHVFLLSCIALTLQLGIKQGVRVM